jgi:hypothetical protein
MKSTWRFTSMLVVALAVVVFSPRGVRPIHKDLTWTIAPRPSAC